MGTTEAAMVTCAQCARSFRWKPELARKKVKCKCGGRIEFPSSEPVGTAEPLVAVEEQPAVAGRPRAKAGSSENGGFQIGLEDDLPALSPAELAPVARLRAAASPRLAGQAVCPTCSSPVMPQAVICTRCGTNVRTGSKLKTTVKGPGVDGGDVAKVAGKVVLSMVLGGVTAVICAVLWLLVIMITGFSIGYMAIGVGLATGGVIRLVNRSGGTTSGFAAAGFALFSLALVKGVLMWGASKIGVPLMFVFSPFDILWAFLAVSSAFKLGAGLGS